MKHFISNYLRTEKDIFSDAMQKAETEFSIHNSILSFIRVRLVEVDNLNYINPEISTVMNQNKKTSMDNCWG